MNTQPTTAIPKTTSPPIWKLLRGQVRYQNTVFWRTPVAAFFTLVFPLMFLVLFQLLFGGTIDTPVGELSIAQFFAPALAAFAAANATYVNLAVGTATDRDLGVLKRFRSTPLPPGVYVAGRVVSGVWLALVATTVMFTVAISMYDVSIPTEGLLPATVTFVFGVAAFSALGFAVSSFTKNGDAAVAATNATLLPMAFVSGVFIPLEDPPAWLNTLGDILPLKHFVNGMQTAVSPFAAGSRWDVGDLVVLAVWGVIGLGVALRFFRWEPQADSGDDGGDDGNDASGEAEAAQAQAGRAPGTQPR